MNRIDFDLTPIVVLEEACRNPDIIPMLWPQSRYEATERIIMFEEAVRAGRIHRIYTSMPNVTAAYMSIQTLRNSLRKQCKVKVVHPNPRRIGVRVEHRDTDNLT